MPKRYVCLICRHEIAHPGAECPYCKSRSMIAEGASPRMLAIVFAVMTLIFVLTGFYTRSFNNESRKRGELYFKSAQLLMAEQEYEDAIGDYRDALLYSRDNSDYRLGLARALYASGHSSETETHLIELRAADPTSGIVNQLLARLAAQAGQTDAAVSYYRTAIYGKWNDEPEETRLQLRLELVTLLEDTSREQQLTAELLELLEIVPEDRTIRHRLAGLLLKTRVYDRSSSLFAELIGSDPSDRKALLGRAEAEFHLGNYLTARTHYNRAQLHGRDDATREHIELCNRIIALDPTRRGIGVDERYRRSRVLVDRARAAVESCRNPVGEDFVGPLPPLQPDLETALNRADELLARRSRRRASDEAVEASIQLAENVWSAGAPLCPQTGPPDEPLFHVMAKLSR